MLMPLSHDSRLKADSPVHTLPCTHVIKVLDLQCLVLSIATEIHVRVSSSNTFYNQKIN